MVRNGVRVARGTVVVHAASSDTGSRAGFVVSRAVGNAVTRNRVKRQLRHLVAHAFRTGTTGVDVVVRALPGAGGGSVREDFSRAWAGSMERLAAA